MREKKRTGAINFVHEPDIVERQLIALTDGALVVVDVGLYREQVVIAGKRLRVYKTFPSSKL